jgi:adenosine deaminase
MVNASPAKHGDDLEAFIQDMPKGELHVHLEGCLTPELVRTFAERNKLDIPSALSTLDQSGGGYAFNDLTSFLSLYYACQSILQTAEDFQELAFDVS